MNSEIARITMVAPSHESPTVTIPSSGSEELGDPIAGALFEPSPEPVVVVSGVVVVGVVVVVVVVVVAVVGVVVVVG